MEEGREGRGSEGGTKGDVFAITCALRYRGGRVERKQCRVSTCTRLSEASRKQIEILRVATNIQMRFYQGTRYVFDVFGHLFAARVLFLPSARFELDSNFQTYRSLSLNNASIVLFFTHADPLDPSHPAIVIILWNIFPRSAGK